MAARWTVSLSGRTVTVWKLNVNSLIVKLGVFFVFFCVCEHKYKSKRSVPSGRYRTSILFLGRITVPMCLLATNE